MASLQSAISQIVDFLSPTPTTSRRVQPRRNKQKRQDEDFIYPTQITNGSIDLTSTLTDSDLHFDTPKRNVVIKNQPVVGDNSIQIVSQSQDVDQISDSPSLDTIPETQSQNVISDTQLTQSQDVIPDTQLSPGVFNSTMSDMGTQSPLFNTPFSEFSGNSVDDCELGPLSSTPNMSMGHRSLSSRILVRPDQTSEESSTQTLSAETSDKLCQTATVKEALTNQDVLLFRSNGNLPILSNFFKFKFSYKGITFSSAEQAFQHRMAIFHSRPDIARNILMASHPTEAKFISKRVKKCEQWHESKHSIMADVLQAKADQCAKFTESLLKTGRKRLIHNIDTDSYWGCGADLLGRNMMGTLLEELRDKLGEQVPTTSMPVSSIPSIQENDVSSNSPSKFGAPTSTRQKTLVLGNSNARGVAQGLNSRGIDAVGYTIPGGTIPYIMSRLKHVKTTKSPDSVLLIAGDIEAANGLTAEAISARLEHLVKEAKQQFPWSRIILSGLPQAGNNYRQNTIREINHRLEVISCNDRLVEFVDNSRARLKDNIHMSNVSKDKLCFTVSRIVKKFSL